MTEKRSMSRTKTRKEKLDLKMKLLNGMRLQQLDQQKGHVEATKEKLKLIFDHYA